MPGTVRRLFFSSSCVVALSAAAPDDAPDRRGGSLNPGWLPILPPARPPRLDSSCAAMRPRAGGIHVAHAHPGSPLQ